MRRRPTRPLAPVARSGAVAAALAALLGGSLVGCGGDPEPRPEPAPARATGDPAGARTAYDHYVALGDSFTAAPLVPPTDTSTICLRSEVNYPALVAEAMPGTELTDVSCSGARTRNLVEPQSGTHGSVPPQLDAVRRGTDLVTIGLGGNDRALFGGTLARCLRLAPSDPTGSPCTDATERTQVESDLRTIRDNLTQVVAAVQEQAPRARVLLVGYPQLIPPADDPGGGCELLPLAWGDYALARELNHGLTEAVRLTAEETGVEYVDTWTPSAGHDICSDDPWVNGRITSADRALAYHPLAAGQQAVAELILDQLASPNPSNQ